MCDKNRHTAFGKVVTGNEVWLYNWLKKKSNKSWVAKGKKTRLIVKMSHYAA